MGSVYNLVISVAAHIQFLRALKTAIWHSVMIIRSTRTLLALSMSMAMGTFSSATKPLTGSEKTACRGPDLQHKKPNVFSKFNVDGSCEMKEVIFSNSCYLISDLKKFLIDSRAHLNSWIQIQIEW